MSGKQGNQEHPNSLMFKLYQVIRFLNLKFDEVYLVSSSLLFENPVDFVVIPFPRSSIHLLDRSIYHGFW